ncbi:serum response factor, partial [Perca flavescens]
MGTRTGAGLNTAGPGPNNDPDVISSGSEPDSDSGEDTAGSGGDRRGVKRERSEREVGTSRGLIPGGLPGAKPGKKTRGRVKIKMEFIDNKLRRYTTFSKRKTGIMKKAYELSTLTGTQVLLLVASETGHVYTFATRKLQPMITSETGKALIQTCLNSPDSPPRWDPSSDQRMSATGFTETDLTYQVAESEGAKDSGIKPAASVSGEDSGIKPAASVSGEDSGIKPAASVSGEDSGIKPAASVSGEDSGIKPAASVSGEDSGIKPAVSVQLQGGAPCWTPSSTNGTLLKTAAGVVLPAGFTLMSGGGVSQQLQSIQLQPSTNQSSSDTRSPPSSTASVSSSSSSGSGHMMYPGGHTVMYAAPTSSLADGSLTVLNTFPPTGHAQSHDPALPQVFLTSLPPGGAQIPVSAVQLHQMVISQQSSSNLTELQVISL